MEVIGIGKVLLLVKFRLLYNISIKMIESVILNSVKIGYVRIYFCCSIMREMWVILI